MRALPPVEPEHESAVASSNVPEHCVYRLFIDCTVVRVCVQESVGMKTVELVFFDAGGGHRSAANALCEVVQRRRAALGDEDDESPGTARRDGCFPQADGRSPAGPLQPDADDGLDARVAGADERYARRHPRAAWEAGAAAFGLLEQEPAGYCRFADSEFQSPHVRCHRACDAARADGDDPHRHGRLSAALLDRTAEAVLHLRDRARLLAGDAISGIRRTACSVRRA